MIYQYLEFIQEPGRNGELIPVQDCNQDELLNEAGIKYRTSINEIAAQGWELAFAYPLFRFDGNNYSVNSRAISVMIFKKATQ